MPKLDTAETSNSGLRIARDIVQALPPRARYATTAAAVVGVLGVVTEIKKAHSDWLKARRFTITVEGSERYFVDLLDWVHTQIPPGDRRDIRTVLVDGDSHQPMSDGDGMIAATPESSAPPPPVLRRVYSGLRNTDVVVGKHKVEVEVKTETHHSGRGLPLREQSIHLHCSTPEARDAVLDLLERLALSLHQAEVDHFVPVFSINKWGRWTRSNVRKRPASSIVMADGIVDRVTRDLKTFLDSETLYTNLGIPWHRGYVLEGPPGVGK